MRGPLPVLRLRWDRREAGTHHGLQIGGAVACANDVSVTVDYTDNAHGARRGLNNRRGVG
jgi:hypothetical protein